MATAAVAGLVVVYSVPSYDPILKHIFDAVFFCCNVDNVVAMMQPVNMPHQKFGRLFFAVELNRKDSYTIEENLLPIDLHLSEANPHRMVVGI